MSYTVQVRHFTRTEPGTYPDEVIVTVYSDTDTAGYAGEYLRLFGTTVDTASGDRGVVTDQRWFAQPSGMPVDEATQAWLDERVVLTYEELPGDETQRHPDDDYDDCFNNPVVDTHEPRVWYP